MGLIGSKASLALLFLCLMLAACAGNPFLPANSRLAAACNPIVENAAASNNVDAIQLEVWGRAYGEFCWRTYALHRAATQGTDAGVDMDAAPAIDARIQVIPGPFLSTRAPYQQALAAAAKAGIAPDIAHVGGGDLAMMQRAGYLVPLDECLRRHASFDDILDALWEPATIDDQVWGIPFEVGLHYFLFNKHKLAELGWAEARIADLPRQIQAGEFTLDHALETAHEAIAQGVVAPGFGFWPHHNRFNNLWTPYIAFGGRVYNSEDNTLQVNRAALIQTYAFQRRLIADQLALDSFTDPESLGWIESNIWHDTVTHNRALFWQAEIGEWSGWVENYLDPKGQESDLLAAIGHALYPSGMKGHAGIVTWANTAFHVVIAPSASGRTRQDAACDLMAAVATPKINNANAIRSRYMGVLKSQRSDPAYLADRFNAETRYMWDYAHNVAPRHPRYGDYYAILVGFMERAMTGEFTPTAAANMAIAELRVQLGEMVIIDE